MSEYANLSITELRKRGQSGAPEAGRDPYVGLTIRFFSVYLTKLALYTSITPNQMTFLSVCVFLAGVSTFFFASMGWGLFGCFLIYLSVVLDGCDGELARIRGNRSGVGGIYTEPLSHDIQYALMFFPIAIGLVFAGVTPWILLVAWVATVMKLLYRFLIVRFDTVLVHSGPAKTVILGGEGDSATVFNPNVSFPHKVYRWFNRNVFSSVALVVPLLITVFVGRVDIFLWLFAGWFTLIAFLHFIKQVFYVSRIGENPRQ